MSEVERGSIPTWFLNEIHMDYVYSISTGRSHIQSKEKVVD